MNPPYNSLNHALHNESVCNELNNGSGREDWVITTAFYSALHFLRHKIFPLKFKKDGKNLKATTFNKYCILIGKQGQKHSIFKKVVREYCPKRISVSYNKMLDASYTARYNSYRFSPQVAKEVKNQLSAIKKYCM